MDKSAAIKLCLLLLGFAFVTNFVASYMTVGIIICKVINYFVAVVLLGLLGYSIFYMLKSDKPNKQKFVIIAIGVLCLAGSIGCFVRTKYITEYTKTSRFFLAFFPALGVYQAIGLVWPQIMLKFFSSFIQAFEADFLQIVSVGIQAVSALIAALFVLIPDDSYEDFFVQHVCGFIFIAVLINTIWTAALGLFLQFKAESGYASTI